MRNFRFLFTAKQNSIRFPFSKTNHNLIKQKSIISVVFINTINEGSSRHEQKKHYFCHGENDFFLLGKKVQYDHYSKFLLGDINSLFLLGFPSKENSKWYHLEETTRNDHIAPALQGGKCHFHRGRNNAFSVHDEMTLHLLCL